MHRKVKFIVASFCLLPFFVLSEAEAFNGCNQFSVYFQNETPFDCNVVDSKLHHGFWVTPPIKGTAPDTLYTAAQSFYGPDAEVTLRCAKKDKGYYTFTVKNQQNLCFLAGGDQANTVVSKDKGINVTNVIQQHAAWKFIPGVARVTVKL